MHMLWERERERCFILDHNYRFKCTSVPYHPYITILEQLISTCVKLYLAKHRSIYDVFNNISKDLLIIISENNFHDKASIAII